jgi:hypothetical protein
VTTVRLSLLPVKYGIDTRLLGVPPEFWSLRCSPEENRCCEAFNCNLVPLVCKQNACATDFKFEAYATVDLRSEAPALTRVGAGERSRLTISNIRFDAQNDLNTDLPALDLYMAPLEVQTASDPRAQKFARIPLLKAGRTVTGGAVQLYRGSGDTFARYARAWGAFNMIVNAPIDVRSTMTPLAGQAAMIVTIEVAASLDL